MRYLAVLLCTGFLSWQSARADVPTPTGSWQEIVRASPYWVSKGAFDNLSTIRQWVLTGTGYCEQKQRHILFDRRGTFLGYFSHPDNSTQSQALLNVHRAQLVTEGKVEDWATGTLGQSGYPFALSCDQPAADLDQALKRYTGKVAAAQLWGTWDGMRIGTPQNTVSLHQALLEVYQDRFERGRISLPVNTLSTLAGKILIESGGRARAHSGADAKGIMQLSPQALADCQLDKRFHFHRMAQIDCAFKLLEQNHRLLQPEFTALFGHLPENKRDTLYAYLLIQAYHGGIGRVTNLLNDKEMNKPATYFAEHHAQYSAGDIALGMIYHNLGRDRLGFSSLYYVIDVHIAKQYACNKMKDLPGC